jgi:alpha-D-xyloside xylohydrolase
MPPTEQIPLYVRGNCLLPLAAPVEHVADDASFELTVRAYGKSPVPFTLYEDDGISFDYEKGAQNQIVLMWSGGKGSVERKAGAYQGAERYWVTAWEAIVG